MARLKLLYLVVAKAQTLSKYPVPLHPEVRKLSAPLIVPPCGRYSPWADLDLQMLCWLSPQCTIIV